MQRAPQVRNGVKNGSGGIYRTCPLLPQLRTFFEASGTSAKCHQETHALQQLAALFDHLVGAQQE
jgi:hypothetical protein